MKWISVKDELPKPYTTVLLGNCETGYMSLGSFLIDNWSDFTDGSVYPLTDKYSPTHWLPVPELPENL